jgi:hypothetical protein
LLSIARSKIAKADLVIQPEEDTLDDADPGARARTFQIASATI